MADTRCPDGPGEPGEAPGPSRRARRLLIVGIVVGFLPNLPHLAHPLAGDHFIHGWVGWRWSLGEWPYTHQAEHNFPGGAMLYAAAATVFGPGAFGYRLLDWLWELAAGMMMFRVAGRLAGRWVGLVAMIVYGVAYGALEPGTAGNRDPMLTLLYLASAELLCKRTRKSVLAAGLLSSMIVLIKPTHGLWWLAAGGWLIWQVRGRPRPIATTLAWAGACLAPVVLLAAGYALAGHWREMMDCAIRYNLAYGGMSRPFITLTRPEWLMLAICAWGVVRTAWPADGRDRSILCFLWLLAAVGGALTQRKYLEYHLFPARAALTFWAVVGAGMIVRDLARALAGVAGPATPIAGLAQADVGELARRIIARARRVPPRIAGWCAIAAIAAASMAIRAESDSFRTGWSAASGYLAGDLSSAEAAARFGPAEMPESIRLAEHIRRRTAAHEGIVVFAFHPEIAYRAGRGSPSRFFIPRMIFAYRDDDPDPLWRRWQEEFTADLLDDPPAFLVFRRADLVGDWTAPLTPRKMVSQRMPRIETLLRERYRPVEGFPGYVVYERIVR